MKIGLIGAMNEEITFLQEQMTEVESWQEAQGHFFGGKIAGIDIILVESGIGKVNAAIIATLLIGKYGCTHLLNTGSAGGIGRNLKVGDVVVATELAYHDADNRAFDYAYGQIPQMPLNYPTDAFLREQAQIAAEKTQLSVHQGQIVSGDSFIADSEKVTMIQSYFPDALAVEMESTAIAQVAYQFGIPFVIIRAMSDTADGDANISFDEFIIEAGKKSGEMILSLLTQLAK